MRTRPTERFARQCIKFNEDGKVTILHVSLCIALIPNSHAVFSYRRSKLQSNRMSIIHKTAMSLSLTTFSMKSARKLFFSRYMPRIYSRCSHETNAGCKGDIPWFVGWLQWHNYGIWADWCWENTHNGIREMVYA